MTVTHVNNSTSFVNSLHVQSLYSPLGRLLFGSPCLLSYMGNTPSCTSSGNYATSISKIILITHIYLIIMGQR